MKKQLLLGLLLAVGCPLVAQEVAYVKSDQITRWKNSDSDTLYVLNFWASWCAPCIAELPAFERITREYAGKPVKVILVSTDFRRDVEKKVKPFVRRKKLKSRVVFLDETTPNKWIDLVSPEWTGAIPATLIVCRRRGVERFFEKQLDFEALENAVTAGLNAPVR